MKAAVIGAGVFGATTAVELARSGASVDLFEARGDILLGATANCQARLHRGYHYPRSDATATAARDAFDVFADRFPQAVRPGRHHYVIAETSRVHATDYLAFCDRLGLTYQVLDESPFVHHAQLTLAVPEAFVDVDVLRRLLRAQLFQAGVSTHCNRWVAPEQLDHDLIVVATYGQPWSRPLRYEVCEVAVLKLGHYSDESFVVLDGPFVSLDPWHGSHLLYDVEHSVRAVHIGYDIPPPVLPATNVTAMLDSASRHLIGMDPHGRGVCVYQRSLFAVRAVLPDVEDTDERPTLVERDGNVISILGGKICTAVTAAASVASLVPA